MKDTGFKQHFMFTQQSLSAFDSCPMKFRKRYIENLKWDHYPDEKSKKRLELGNDFHLLARRYFQGIDPGLEQASEKYEELEIWMRNLKSSFKIKQNEIYLPEYKLRISRGIMKLEANFDLLRIVDGRIEIWDWKTREGHSGSKKERDSKSLRNSLQTKVYMYVLKEGAELVFGREPECESISMHYWQPDPPHTLLKIGYDSEKHEEFGNMLESKINEIFKFDYEDFDRSLYKKQCKFCEFNWLCNNGRVDFKLMEENRELLYETDREDTE